MSSIKVASTVGFRKICADWRISEEHAACWAIYVAHRRRRHPDHPVTPLPLRGAGPQRRRSGHRPIATDPGIEYSIGPPTPPPELSRQIRVGAPLDSKPIRPATDTTSWQAATPRSASSERTRSHSLRAILAMFGNSWIDDPSDPGKHEGI